MRALLAFALAACEMGPPSPRPAPPPVDVDSGHAPARMQVLEVIAREYGTERRIPGLTVRIRDLVDCHSGDADACPGTGHTSGITGGDGTARFELPYPQASLHFDVESVGKDEGYATYCPIWNHGRSERKYPLVQLVGSTYVCHLVPFSALAAFDKQGAIRAARKLPDVQRWLATDPRPEITVEDMRDAEWQVMVRTDRGSQLVLVDAIDGSAQVMSEWELPPEQR